MKKTKIFVYGTLRLNGSNYYRMKKSELITSATRIKGYEMYSKKDYPIAIATSSISTIVGDIFHIDEHLLIKLDKYEEVETKEYHRIWDQVYKFWIYVSPINLSNLESIPGGDWNEYIHH